MSYVITFLEGLISFISPCMLPLLPLYVSYFAGGAGEKNRKVFVRALSFVVGFTSVFCLLGLFAGTLGALLTRYSTVVDIVCGAIIILFGLSYLEIINIPIFKGMQTERSADSVISAFIFGILYSVSLTPCIGAFLGSALALAAKSGTVLQGLLLLLVYSLGLGIPFLISAILIDKLGQAFTFIKRHYKVINLVCGIFLIVIGILIAVGLYGRLMSKLI